MPSNQLPPITRLPVLIKSGDHAAMNGVGVLFTRDTTISGLHEVSKKEALAGDRLKRLDSKARQIVSGVALFQLAIRRQDWTRFRQALDLVKDYVPHFGGDAEIQHIRERENWKEAQWAFSGLMSNLLRDARFLIWYSPKGGRSRPGLFCPDWKVAVYAIAGMDHLRICEKPGCGELFIPTKDDNTYCVTAHQNAHNQALWKAANPERAKELRKKKASQD